MVANATTTAATPPVAAEQDGGRGHEEKMPQFPADRAAQVEIKKMPLPKNRLHIAPDEVEKEHAAGKTQEAGMQKHGAEKLPGDRLDRFRGN